ncbi:DNA-processing protein DprA [Nocardioides terrisoli]|uniref:DNA-processing protein DprA n=1 Tax=Nocardioides terrisoli TaxID=3388267 RepID=UPI00287B7888|nr:DNA-processing protein DprA [Nocardioides marmorisolisilvae]
MTAGPASSVVTEEERLARVTLNRVVEPGHPGLLHRVATRGAVTVLRELSAGARIPEAADLAQRLAEADPTRDLEEGERHGLRFIVPGDREWPPGLDGLTSCPELHRRGGVPIGLWLRGCVSLAATVTRAGAVVGARSATSYGENVAGQIGHGLASAGWTVVSGAAYGIDQGAHRGALAAGGPTVAVLACGADKAYPKAHERLLDFIAESGVIVSEAPLGGAPTRIRFLARNRLIAALAAGTVVVEAAVRSGALNTASWTAGLGRVLMGVPGPVTSEPSSGVHQLIRERGAILVTRPEEVLEALAPVGEETLFPLRAETTARDRLTDLERQVLDAVPVHSAAGEENIGRVAGVSPSTVGRALKQLERVELIERLGGRWRLRRQADD